MNKVRCPYHGDQSIIGMGAFAVTLSCRCVGNEEEGWTPQGRQTVSIMASNGKYWDSHSVSYGGHVLEDTHCTRDGHPMSASLSFLTNCWTVVVDDNEYN